MTLTEKELAAELRAESLDSTMHRLVEMVLKDGKPHGRSYYLPAFDVRVELTVSKESA